MRIASQASLMQRKHTYSHTYIHTYIHASKHTYIHTCIHAATYTCRQRLQRQAGQSLLPPSLRSRPPNMLNAMSSRRIPSSNVGLCTQVTYDHVLITICLLASDTSDTCMRNLQEGGRRTDQSLALFTQHLSPYHHHASLFNCSCHLSLSFPSRPSPRSRPTRSTCDIAEMSRPLHARRIALFPHAT